MSSARKLTQIPSCMRMSFIYPWEDSPEKEIDDPLSYDLPNVTSDFEAIYGEGAAKHFFPSTPTKGDNTFPLLQDDSQCADVFSDMFGGEPTPESPSKAEGSPISSSGYASDFSSSSRISPSPSPKHGVPGGKKEQQTTISNARARRVPYQRRPLDPPPSTASPLSRSDYSRSPPSPASLSSTASSSVSSNPDDVVTPEFMRSLQLVIPMAGSSSLPEGHSPAPSVNPPQILPQRHSKSPVKSRPSPSRPPQGDASQEAAAFAHRYCRFRNCEKRFADKRTTERHRLTHLDFGTYVCPNPACDSRTKGRPHFASDFSLGRHLRLAADDSPCAVGKGHKLSSFRLNAAQVEALIQSVLVPFDSATHVPFLI